MMMVDNKQLSKRANEPLTGRDMLKHKEGVLKLEHELDKSSKQLQEHMCVLEQNYHYDLN